MTSMHYKIRKAHPEEALLLSDIIKQSFQDVARRFNLTPDNCPKHPSNCTKQWIQNDFQRGVIYFLLEIDGMPAGCVALEKADQDLCFLERLAVLPAHRNSGFGRLLVEFIIRQAKDLKARQISIGIIAEQTELGSWYRNIGFTAKKTKNFPHLPFTVLFMEYPCS